MTILTVSEVVKLHEKLIVATGGSHGVRDIGLLESAVQGCNQTFDDTELYPTIIEKAARMAYTLCKNHPFVDGNKRTAVTSMLVMLRLNGINLSYTQQELIALGLGIADSNIEYKEILVWLKKHMQNQ